MPDWPLIEGQRFEKAGLDTANSRGAAVTANAAAHTKGNYAQLIAATAFAVRGIIVELNLPSAGTDYLVDIAIGAAASEVVIAENLYSGTGTGTASRGSFYYLPIAIPAGTRIAARLQATTGAAALRVSVLLLSQGFLPSQPLSIVTTYGVDTSDSGGVQVDPGATINTKGAYSEIVASTSRAIRVLNVAFGNQVNTARTNCNWITDLAVGAAGSEQILIPDICSHADANADAVCPMASGPYFCNIPAGTRLAARSACLINDATDRLFDLIIYGVS
jgi:hypothetical protein